MAFVIIGIGDRPNSVKLDAYHIDRTKVQTRFLISFCFTRACFPCRCTSLSRLCKVAIS
jgi:hypothetical protein